MLLTIGVWVPVNAQPLFTDECAEFFIYDNDNDSVFSVLDAPQRFISEYMEEFVQNTDEFFANEKVYYTSSGSYIRLTMESSWQEGGTLGYAGDVRIKVRLPVTQGKLKILLESDPDETRDPLERRSQTTPAAAVDDKTYYAGVQGSFGREIGWRYEPSIGLRLQSPLDPYVRFRGIRNYQFEQDDLLSINAAAYWYDSFGAGYDGLLEYNHKLETNKIGRSSSFARWTADTNYFYLSQVFSVIETLSEHRAITWYTGVYGKSEPVIHATDYLFGLRYRQDLHKRYLFLEINPELRFQKDHDFADEFALYLKLEVLFQE